MSHGTHRKPRTTTRRRLRRIAAGLSLAAATATGAALTNGLTEQASADTTWGAPDTDPTPVTPTPDTGGDDGTVVTPLDTTWG